jgi:hypothetical protein
VDAPDAPAHASAGEERVPVAAAVAQLTSEYLDLVFDTFPTPATVFGRHEHDGRLEVLTSDRLDDFARRLAEPRRRVTAVAPADEEEAVDRDALAAAISEALLAEELERPWPPGPGWPTGWRRPRPAPPRPCATSRAGWATSAPPASPRTPPGKRRC